MTISAVFICYPDETEDSIQLHKWLSEHDDWKLLAIAEQQSKDRKSDDMTEEYLVVIFYNDDVSDQFRKYFLTIWHK